MIKIQVVINFVDDPNKTFNIPKYFTADPELLEIEEDGSFLHISIDKRDWYFNMKFVRDYQTELIEVPES
jgi:hypothetical protein